MTKRPTRARSLFWRTALLACAACAPTLACTSEQDLGDRPSGDGPGGPGGPGDGGPGGMRVFLTRTYYSSSLKTEAKRPSGIEGGDALCQLAADGARLGGNWAAWLSDGNIDAIDRVADDGPWQNLTPGRPVVAFRNRVGIGSMPLHDLTDEYGTSGGNDFWSGTLPSGRASTMDCESWSYHDATGYSECYGTKRLLCLEQKAPLSRKRVFVSSKELPAAFAGTSSTTHAYEVADQFCNDSAKAAKLDGQWRAWLSSNASWGNATVTRRAIERMASRVGSWTLVDSTTVAISSRDEFVSGLTHAIDHNELNQVVPSDTPVWTGTAANGDQADTCSGFSNPYSGQATVGLAGQTNSGWTSHHPIACSAGKSARLYCFEQ